MRLLGRALRAGEELVPGPVQRPLALHQQRQRRAAGHQLPQRVPRQHRRHLRRQRRRQPGRGRAALVAQGVHGGEEEIPRVRLGHPGRRPLVQPGALLQDHLRVHARGDLDLRVVPPGGDRVAPALHGVRPQPGRTGGDLRPPPVRARSQLPHRRERPRASLGVPQDDIGGHRVVPLAEHGGRDLERLAHDGLRRPAPLLDHRPDVEDGDAPHRGRGGRFRVRGGRPGGRRGTGVRRAGRRVSGAALRRRPGAGRRGG